MTFNVGDKVRVIKGDSPLLIIGNILTVAKETSNRRNGFIYFEEVGGGWDSTRFELVEAYNPLIEAKLLLEKNGFTVTDPPKPRTRDVVAYCFDKNPETVHFAELHYFVNKRNWASPPIRIGGTFQWTEELKL